MLIHWQCMDNMRAVYTKQHGKCTLIHTLYAHAKRHRVHTYWWLKCILMRQYWCTLCIAHCVQLQTAYLWLQLSGVTLKSAHAHCVCALCTHCVLLWCTTWASGSGAKYKVPTKVYSCMQQYYGECTSHGTHSLEGKNWVQSSQTLSRLRGTRRAFKREQILEPREQALESSYW